MTLFDKIKEVTELQSLPGFESEVRNHIRQKITPHVDRIETDGLGGILGLRTRQLNKHRESWLQVTWMKSAL